MSKWVQHKSGQGEKWEVDERYSEHNDFYRVRQPHDSQYVLRLPISEYIECSPPEEWEDVTAECDWGSAGEGLEATIFHSGLSLLAGRGYRLRRVKLYPAELGTGDNRTKWAFIVERRKS